MQVKFRGFYFIIIIIILNYLASCKLQSSSCRPPEMHLILSSSGTALHDNMSLKKKKSSQDLLKKQLV